MILKLAETQLSIRQALATGQLTEAITGRSYEHFGITLSYSHSGSSGLLPVKLQKKPGGFFALQFSPERDMPDFSALPSITLTATISIQGKAPFDLTQTVPGSSLALSDTASNIGGMPVTYRRVNGAPLDFSAQLPPAPVALQGIILRDHDPANPVGNITVTTTPAAPGGPVSSNADGIFFIPALPVAEAISLDLNEGGTPTGVSFRPDYTKPVNTRTFSLAAPSP